MESDVQKMVRLIKELEDIRKEFGNQSDEAKAKGVIVNTLWNELSTEDCNTVGALLVDDE